MELNTKNSDSGPEEDFEELIDSMSQLQVPSVRTVNLILDNSSFIRGFGNIKRWFDQTYIKSQLLPNGKHPRDKIQLNIYLPSYTLHQLEHLRKGNSMLATNARKALSFIDKIFDSEETQGSFDSNFVENIELIEAGIGKKSEVPLRYNVYIEYRDVTFPTWNKCLAFKLYDLYVNDFPSQQTKFSSDELLGRLTFDPDAQEEIVNGPVPAPPRLKHLIRSCVFKQYLEVGSKNNSVHEQWKLITEDTVTRVWANSFGINCLNVNEAELLIFQSTDITSFNVKTEGYDFNSEKDIFDKPVKGILHQRIDTTAYEYHNISDLNVLLKMTEDEATGKSTKGDQKNTVQKGEKSPPIVPSGAKGDEVKKEDFDMINFAPRVNGKLWKPTKLGKKRK